jgi:gluconokinase
MMNTKAIIGADIGTTGCRAVVYSIDGSVLASHSLEYPLYTPQPAWAEQDPQEIYQAFLTVVSQAVLQANLRPAQILVISLSSVFHSIIPVDNEGHALYRMLNWTDSRSQLQAEKIKATYDAQAIYSKTSCQVHTMYLPAKILCFREEKPAIFEQTARFISIKEYILFRLLGKFVIDKSIASGSGLYNIYDQCWDPALLLILGISAKQLSTVWPTTHNETPLLAGPAATMGLSPDTPVVLGAGDGVVSSVGSGAVNPGQLTAMIGTSGAVRVVTDKPRVDPKGRTWCLI